MASGDGDGIVVKTTGCTAEVVNGAEAECANVHESGCKNKNDGKGHASEKRDLTMSCPMSSANENGWENNIADARTKKMRTLLVWGIGRWLTAPPRRLQPLYIIPRSGVIPGSTSASRVWCGE